MVAIVATVGCDRVTKHMATTSLAGEHGRSYFSDTIRLEYVVRGSVVHFINLGVGPFRTGIFNVADVALALGAALLILRQREHHIIPDTSTVRRRG